MKTKKYWIWLAVLSVVFVFLSVRVLGISYSIEKVEEHTLDRLKGLTKVGPLAALYLGEEEKHQVRLTDKDLQAQVELALRRAGIKLMEDKNDRSSAYRGGVLTVDINVKRVKDLPLYSFTVSTDLCELVEISTFGRGWRSRSSQTLSARTWPINSWSHLSIADSENVEKAIQDEVAEQIKEFINDYLAANPKEQSTENKKRRPKDD